MMQQRAAAAHIVGGGEEQRAPAAGSTCGHHRAERAIVDAAGADGGGRQLAQQLGRRREADRAVHAQDVAQADEAVALTVVRRKGGVPRELRGGRATRSVGG
jgi:hypothetical protein